MDRTIWQLLRSSIVSADRRTPRSGRRPRYADAQVVKMYFWAVAHDRPLCWACRREHYHSLYRPAAVVAVVGRLPLEVSGVVEAARHDRKGVRKHQQLRRQPDLLAALGPTFAPRHLVGHRQTCDLPHKTHQKICPLMRFALWRSACCGRGFSRQTTSS